MAVVVVSGVLVIAGCGGSRKSSSASRSVSSGVSAGVAFSRCMRSHAVPNFPDPNPDGGFPTIGGPRGINVASPAFRAAEKACQHILPGAVLGASGHPSARVLKEMLVRTRCMRAHGVSEFPDPMRSPPADPGDGAVIGSNGAYFWLHRDTINYLSPAFKEAAATCGFNLP